MSQQVKHMCGQELERASPTTSNQAPNFWVRGSSGINVTCPRCGVEVCDTECTDMAGVPLPVYNQSEWSKRRRRELGWVE